MTIRNLVILLVLTFSVSTLISEILLKYRFSECDTHSENFQNDTIQSIDPYELDQIPTNDISNLINSFINYSEKKHDPSFKNWMTDSLLWIKNNDSEKLYFINIDEEFSTNCSVAYTRLTHQNKELYHITNGTIKPGLWCITLCKDENAIERMIIENVNISQEISFSLIDTILSQKLKAKRINKIRHQIKDASIYKYHIQNNLNISYLLQIHCNGGSKGNIISFLVKQLSTP
ncbi:hypothetical protein ACXR6G_18845 [Ancylomarina sp. YFZ004]